jgi:hypothetical protein
MVFVYSIYYFYLFFSVRYQVQLKIEHCNSLKICIFLFYIMREKYANTVQ